MIFIGDIACPDEYVDAFIECTQNLNLFSDEIVIANLEGMFPNENIRPDTLYNSERVFDGFKKAKKIIVSVANNHTYDYPNSIIHTLNTLHNQNIGTFGLFEENQSLKPYIYTDKNGEQYAFFGHCWNLYTTTNPNRENNIRIADCQYQDFFQIISNFIGKNPKTKVYCFMHWNYDLESLPFPVHRKLSRDLIDLGVESVIGTHSHIVQGGEIYNGKVIIYGLGNFYIPSGFFFNKKLNYPAESHITMAINLPQNGEPSVIWFRTDTGGIAVKIELIESFCNGKIINSYSPYRTFTEKKYLSFFKQNRVKRILVPVFNDYGTLEEKLKNFWAKSRITIIKTIKK